MPQVPTYDGPQVRTQALQPVFQRTPDVSSGTQAIARGLGQVTEELDRKIVRDAQDEAFKLELQIRTDWQKQRAALRNQYKGELADQYKTAADEWWAKAPETYGKAASPMARQMATRSIGQYALQSEADTLGYVEGEKKRSREINFRTLQDGIVSEAGQLVTPENARALAATTAQRLNDNAIAYAVGEGQNSDFGKGLAREQLNRFHADVALALANQPNGAAAAQAYLSEFGKDIPLAVRTRVDGTIKAAANEQEGVATGRRLAALPYEQRKAELDKITNPDVLKIAQQTIDGEETRRLAALRQVSDQMEGNLMLQVQQGRPPKAAEIEQLRQVDPKAAARVQQAINAERKAAAAAAKGEPIKTDWATYIDARERLAAGEKINLIGLKDRIAPAQMEQLLDIQTKAKNPSKAPEVASSEQQLGAFTTSLDLKGENLGKFKAAAYDMFNEHLKRTGKEPTFEERDKIMRDLNREIVTKPGWLWDTKEPAFKAEPETRRRALTAPAAPTAPLRVKNVEEARALKPGTVFIDPQGVERIR